MDLIRIIHQLKLKSVDVDTISLLERKKIFFAVVTFDFKAYRVATHSVGVVNSLIKNDLEF